ncbi:sodium/glutamate symporter [Roseovarius dicentrarchi]|uniref:sodium/glutamate symporter n=1 Tax=Roseovarius dicentrarchi TaxID=2250573 RepID=UPI000DEBD524|nr:sodium/glutamate symporter [Roseovarius dicentrarchi]
MDLPPLPAIRIDGFAAFTIAIIVYFAGVHLTTRIAFLRTYSIPEPVSGGIAAALIAWGVVAITGRAVEFDLGVRDLLLVYFFTTVGMSARIADLVKGGRMLALLLVLTAGFMIVQAGIGLLGAALFGLPSQAGVMMGTAALIGGHGTAIAWGPVVADTHGVTGAAELGIATATLGLIVASLLGGPIARYLIVRHAPALPAAPKESYGGAALEEHPRAGGRVSNGDLLRSILWLNIAVAIGVSAHAALEDAGVKLPLFVPCLIAGIVISNVVPRIFRRIEWPSGTPAMGLIQEFSLSVFLSMSLMSMQLWTLADHAGVLAVTVAMQAAAATLFIVFVVFRAMGRDYFAAVICSGFTGVTLGATPTAIANMTAVTQRYGAAPLAFIVLPLVSAFFVDLINAVLIQLVLGL